MGIGRFLKTLVSPKAMAEEIIRLQAEIYRATEKALPDADPHILLALVWLSRMKAARKVDPNDPASLQRAYAETWQFSVMPRPQGVRALGLYFLHQERADICGAFPEYMHEYNEILAPGLKAMHSGEFFTQYAEINPNMSYSNGATGWLFEVKA